MKIDRFSSAFIRKAGALLIGLLFVAGAAPAGVSIHVGPVTFGINVDSHSKKLAAALAPQVAEVQKRFDENRRALRTVKGPRGKPAYLRPDVTGLIARTGEDLDQAIEKVQPAGTEPLRAWTAEEIRRLQEGLAPPPGQTAALPRDLFAPRAVARVASLSGFPLPRLASVKAAAPQQDTVPAEKADSLLDQVGAVVGRIFFLAAHDDLEVKLWVGSAQASHATFSFWPQGRLKGAAPAPLIIRTDGQRDHVLRGLYAYRATYSEGPVTELVQYPSPAGAPATQLVSERLDLVNGSSFFCCRFNEQYCHHVASDKECRP